MIGHRCIFYAIIIMMSCMIIPNDAAPIPDNPYSLDPENRVDSPKDSSQYVLVREINMNMIQDLKNYMENAKREREEHAKQDREEWDQNQKEFAENVCILFYLLLSFYLQIY